MRNFLARLLKNAAVRLNPKAFEDMQPSLGGVQDIGFADAYRKVKSPNANDLLGELKNTAWTCASINSAVCAANPPKLYVQTAPGQQRPKAKTKALSPTHPLAVKKKGIAVVEEVMEHPLLTLLAQVNPVHNQFDLLELTQIYLEVHGSAFWLLEIGDLGIPNQIWVLPSQNVTPRREPSSQNVVDFYEVRTERGNEQYPPEQVIHFRFPDPRNPYSSGLSPLRAAYEQVAMTSQYTAMKRAIYENTGIPSVILSPAEAIGEDERIRLELDWNRKFRRGGMGRALVADSEFKAQILSHSMGDLAALSEMKATKEDIANAFHVPVPYLTGDTNLANMEAAEVFHMRLAIAPRLRRRDEKLNEQLIPLYDPTGRLFLASEDPTPANKAFVLKQQETDLRLGVRTINEIRAERGLEPVEWGDAPLTYFFPGEKPSEGQGNGQEKE